MGYKINLENGVPSMAFDQDTTIGTDLLLSAMIERGSFFLDPSFGLSPAPKKMTAGAAGIVQNNYQKASRWIITAGWAKEIVTQVEKDADKNRLNVLQTATQSNDATVSFENFVPLV